MVPEARSDTKLELTWGSNTDLDPAGLVYPLLRKQACQGDHLTFSDEVADWWLSSIDFCLSQSEQRLGSKDHDLLGLADQVICLCKSCLSVHMNIYQQGRGIPFRESQKCSHEKALFAAQHQERENFLTSSFLTSLSCLPVISPNIM